MSRTRRSKNTSWCESAKRNVKQQYREKSRARKRKFCHDARLAEDYDELIEPPAGKLYDSDLWFWD